MEQLDYSRTAIKDIARADLTSLIFDIVEDMHKMCSQKIDDDNVEYTVKKMVELLQLQYRSWSWGEIRSVMNLGISGSYGNRNERINYQTLSGWLKKAQAGRSRNFADMSIYEANQMKSQTVGDFVGISERWKQFRQWMESVDRWIIDNISERNCNRFHAARNSGTLEEFRQSLVVEPDPAYMEQMKKMTLEKFRIEHEILD